MISSPQSVWMKDGFPDEGEDDSAELTVQLYHHNYYYLH
jgi:hypothetical protein